MSSVCFCLPLEHSRLVETLKKLLPQEVRWFQLFSIHFSLYKNNNRNNKNGSHQWLFEYSAKTGHYKTKTFTNPVVLVSRMYQYWSKPLAWRVASATVEFATVSIAGTTGQSGFAGLAKETHPFVWAHPLCYWESRTCSGEKRFVPEDSATQQISIL